MYFILARTEWKTFLACLLVLNFMFVFLTASGEEREMYTKSKVAADLLKALKIMSFKPFLCR